MDQWEDVEDTTKTDFVGLWRGPVAVFPKPILSLSHVDLSEVATARINESETGGGEYAVEWNGRENGGVIKMLWEGDKAVWKVPGHHPGFCTFRYFFCLGIIFRHFVFVI